MVRSGAVAREDTLRVLGRLLAFACLATGPGILGASGEQAPERLRCTDPSGHYAVEVTRVSQARRFEPWNAQPRTMQVDLALHQSWRFGEPEAALGVTWPRAMVVVDDTGHTVPALSDRWAQDIVVPFTPTKTNFGWQPAVGTARFISPDPGAARIARLVGKAIVWVPGETAEVRVSLTPPVRDRVVTKDRFRATLRSAEWEKDSYVVSLVLQGPGFWRSATGSAEGVPRPGDDVWPGFFQRPTFELLAGEGRSLGSPLVSATRTPGGRQYLLSWDRPKVSGDLKPRELVLRFLACYRNLEIPFEFGNIPLP